MVIHTVKSGDTVYRIAKEYGTTTERIIADNDLADPSSLAVGQDLVILFPERVYTVQRGDTLDEIARMYGTTIQKLLQNNPILKGRSDIFEGQTIVISYTPSPTLGEITTNGYAYPFIETDTLRRTLPYLTYLSIFSYGIRSNGTLIAPIGEERLITLAKEYDTVPLMMLTSLGEGGTFSNELVADILRDEELSRRVIVNAVDRMKEKGYGGIDVDFEYISPDLREVYPEFLRLLKTYMGDDYILFASLAPKTGGNMRGLLYEGHDYASVGAAADKALLMTYEWGYAYGPPLAISPINNVRAVLDYGVTQIPPEKILMGVPNYGYNWTLPFNRERPAEALGNVEAVNLALRKNAEIRYDETSQAPYFTYFDKVGPQAVEHIVWFENARSTDALLRLVREYNIDGAAIWNIMKFFPSLWLVLLSLYNIKKL